MKNYIFCIAILFFASCAKNTEKSSNSFEIENSINQDSIFRPQFNKVFSDSLLMKWDRATFDNVFQQLEIYQDSCIIHTLLEYLQYGYRYRAEFVRVINNDSVISLSDLQNEFYIIESEYCGMSMRYYSALIKTNKDKSYDAVEYLFSSRRTTWLVHQQKKIAKTEFEKLYSKLQNQEKRKIYNFFSRNFFVTKFTKDSIYSYIYCEAPHEEYEAYKEMWIKK